MKIGDIALTLGVTPRSLRFYEEQGLITPARSEGGTRHYTEEHLARFRAILSLTQLGMPLADIGKLAKARPESRTGDDASRKVAHQLETLRQELAERKSQLDRMEADLATAQTLVRQCFGCANPPTRQGCAGCPVEAGRNQAQVLQLVWDQADQK